MEPSSPPVSGEPSVRVRFWGEREPVQTTSAVALLQDTERAHCLPPKRGEVRPGTAPALLTRSTVI